MPPMHRHNDKRDTLIMIGASEDRKGKELFWWNSNYLKPQIMEI